MKQNLLTKVLLLFALIVGSLSTSWAQVSSATPTDGGSYVVAAYVNNKYYALPCTTTNGGTLTGVEIELNSLNKVSTSDASGKTWTLEEGTDDNEGYYYFTYTSGNNTYYLYKNGTGKTNYNFKVSTSSMNYWSFTTNGTGYSVEAIDRGENNTLIQCNNGTFRCYSSATPIILLEIGDAPTSSVANPTIELAAGTYFTAQSVTIITNESGGTTYYTTDGSIPTNASTEYTGAISITETTTVKAITYKGTQSSDVVSATYTIVTAKTIPYQETFDNADGTGGNDGEWSGSIASNSYTNSDWTFEKVYGADKCIKLSTGSAIGSAISSWIAFENGKTYTLLLRAGAWDGDAANIKISYNGGDVIVSSEALTQGKFVNYAYTLTPTGPAKIKIESTGKKRYFIDDFMIVEGNAKAATISSAEYATFSNTEAVDFSANGDLVVYTATDNGSSVTLNEVMRKQVPANKAVVLKGAEGTYAAAVIASAEALADNDLKIAEEDLQGNGKIYVLNKKNGKVGFYKLSSTGTLEKGKAYLETENAAPFLGFDGDDTTGIYSVERGALSVEGCYTLDGRRVAQPTKGLYILNGKKVLIP